MNLVATLSLISWTMRWCLSCLIIHHQARRRSSLNPVSWRAVAAQWTLKSTLWIVMFSRPQVWVGNCPSLSIHMIPFKCQLVYVLLCVGQEWYSCVSNRQTDWLIDWLHCYLSIFSLLRVWVWPIGVCVLYSLVWCVVMVIDM